MSLERNAGQDKLHLQKFRQSSELYSFSDGSKIEGASSTLLRTRSNVRMTIKTSGLDPHGTYTVWWVIFNNPEECENGCGEPDLFNDDVGGSVLYAAGHVIGANGKGNFTGSLRTGDLSGCQAPWDAFDLELIGGEEQFPNHPQLHIFSLIWS